MDGQRSPALRLRRAGRASLRSIACMLVVLAAGAAALGAAGPAGAEGDPNRCLSDPTVVLRGGPEICTFSVTRDIQYPAGTRCAFDVTVHYERTITIVYFENPPRAVAHIVTEGTATGNGNTLRRVSRFTETASPPFVLTDHGLLVRYSLPGGGTVAVWAGYQQVLIDPPLPDIFHGNPFDADDDAAFCGALS
jgi:hypothetical protein